MDSRRRAIAACTRLLSAAASSSSPSTSTTSTSKLRPPPSRCAEIARPIWYRSVAAQPSHGWIDSNRSSICRRSMSCCAGLGSPPPQEIIVEYNEEDYTDDFIKLANAIEEAYPEYIVSGNPNEEVKPRKGAFEISSGEILLFSKLKTNRLPNLIEVLNAIKSLPPVQCPL